MGGTVRIHSVAISFVLLTSLLGALAASAAASAANESETKSKVKEMEEDREPSNSTNKNLGGLGAYLGACSGGYFQLRGIQEGSACEKAGISDGDQIAEIDGKSVKGLNSTEVTSLARGPVGSKLKLKVITEDGVEKEVTIERVDMSASMGSSFYQSNYQTLSRTAKALDTGHDAPRQIDYALNSGDFIGARALHQVALNSEPETRLPFDPTKSGILASAAQFFMSSGSFDQADQLFTEINTYSTQGSLTDTWEPLNITLFADLFERAGRLTEAEQNYKSLIDQLSKLPEYSWKYQETLKRYSRFLLRQNKLSQVSALLRQLETSAGDKLSWQDTEFIADTEYATGAFLQAAESYAKAAAKYEKLSNQSQRKFDRDLPITKLLYKASDALYAAKDYQRAESTNAESITKHQAAVPQDMGQTYERKRDLQPSMSRLLVQQGDVRKAQGKISEANESYEQALSVAKKALSAESPWCKSIGARLSLEKNLTPSREMKFEESYQQYMLKEMLTLKAYKAIKAKAADRIDLAVSCLNEIKDRAGGSLNTSQIAQIFALVELEKDNSTKNALELLAKLKQVVKPDQTLPSLILSVYDDWLNAKPQSGKMNFQKTCSILEKIASDGDSNRGVSIPLYEQLRWLALEWRLAKYPDIASAILATATELRDKEPEPRGDFEKQRALAQFDLKRKEDECLILIEQHKYSEAERIALDPAILRSPNSSEPVKWYQICDAFDKAKQTKLAEKLLLSMANLEQTKTQINPAVCLRLSELYLAAGNYSKAEEFANKVISVKTSHHAIRGYAVLAEALDKQNRMEDAFPAYLRAAADEHSMQESRQSGERKLGYLRRALQIQEKLFGKNDPKVVETLTMLTSALQRSGKYSEVRELNDRIAQSVNKTFKSPDEEIKFWRQMAANYQTAKDPEKAIDALKKVATLEEKSENHWGGEFLHLAQLELTYNQLKEAIADAKKYISSPAYLRSTRDSSSLFCIGGTHDTFVDGLFKAGSSSEALDLLRYAESNLRTKFGAYDRAVIVISAAIAKALARSQDFSGCEATCKHALALLDSARLNEPFVDMHSSESAIESFLAVATALSGQERFEQANDLLQQVLSLQSKFLGKKNYKLASTEFALSNMFVKQRKYSEAKAHAWNSIQIYESHYGRNWHALHHYATEYLNILRELELNDEIASFKLKYKDHYDPYAVDSSSRGSSDLAFFRYDANSLEQGRTKLLMMARKEERKSGPNSSGSKTILYKLIELETYAQNLELVLALQERTLEIISLIDSPEGVEARKQMAEIAETNQKLGRKDESVKMTRKIVSILESIADGALSTRDKFNLIKSYIKLGEKSNALALLSKLSDQCKSSNDDSTSLNQCANYFAQLGESKESERLRALAKNIWNKQQEEAELWRQKQRQKPIEDQ